MSQTERPLSVEEVLELAPDTWINEGVRGIVLFIEVVPMQKRTGKFWKVTLGSETSAAQVAFSIFTAPKFKAKDVIEITGQGNKTKEFSGQIEISTGRNSEIHVVTAAPPPQRTAPPASRAPQDDSRGGQPPNQNPGASEPPPPATADNSPHGANPIPGQEVGMALKEAHILVTMAYNAESKFTLADLDSPLFWRRVFVAASDVLRVSTMLRRGSIAPNVVARGQPPQEAPPAAAAPPPKAEAPPPERHTPPPQRTPPPARKQEPMDEDVPF